ncbi:hypothetical protein [Paraburkholderia sp.]|uniref:hypothetical protein n=1 Tax=Paraburkholderia sp. TaxID=1926495 RepID=UPI0025F23B2E|nr:hypothetical protein [Paraburkholderia sp.]
MLSRVFHALLAPCAMTRHGACRCLRAAAQALALAVLIAFTTLTALTALTIGGCAETPAPPVPFRPVPAERIVLPGYTQPGEGRVAVDVRRERTNNLVVKFRDAPLYVDGERVADLMNGEHVVLYLRAGVHRIAVTTQFDPVVEIRFVVDPRYTNIANVSFDTDHRILIRRVAR